MEQPERNEKGYCDRRPADHNAASRFVYMSVLGNWQIPSNKQTYYFFINLNLGSEP